MKIKPADENCLFALPLVNRCHVNKKRDKKNKKSDMPGDEARRAHGCLQRGWMSASPKQREPLLRLPQEIEASTN